MKIQHPFEFTNNVNRFHSFEMASNPYLIGFSQTPFFEIKIKKSTPTELHEKHHPWSLGFLALISGKVELKRVANPNSLEYKRLEKSEFS